MFQRRRHTLFAIIIFHILLAFVSGCSDDPTPPEHTPFPPVITTPDFLMQHFKQAYERMHPDYFGNLLHDDFRCMILQSTFDAWAGSVNPLDQMYFDRDLDFYIHHHMLGGLAGVNEAGIAQPPIDSISFALLDKEGTWEPVDENEEYFGGRGALKARYNVLIYFENPNNHRFEIDQFMDFYVIQGTDGNWSMLGQKGYPQSSRTKTLLSTESLSYDGLLSMYR